MLIIIEYKSKLGLWFYCFTIFGGGIHAVIGYMQGRAEVVGNVNHW